MQLSITNNIAAVSRGLGKIARKQIPFVTAQTLSALAFEAAREEKKRAPRELDRPTPYTVSGFRYKKANKRTLEALVFIAQSAPGESRDYMRLAINGGISIPQGRALTHPTKNTKLNRYGNLPRTYVKKSLANKDKFFSGVPKGMTGQEHAGLWQRYGTKNNRKIKMMAQWKSSRRYSSKFPFYAIAERVIKLRSNIIFNQQFKRAMLTAR